MRIQNMKRNFLIITISTLIISSCSILRYRMTVQTFNPLLNSPSELSYTPLTWMSDSVGNTIVEKSGFYVPVKIKGIDKVVYMQFDLGSTSTMLYGNTLSIFIEQNKDLQNDTINKDNQVFFKNAEIQLSDSIKVNADKLYVRNDFGYDYIDSSFTILGTLGYDIIGDNILILDFIEDRYALTKEMPSEMQNKIQYIEKPSLDKFPIILPFKLGKKKIRLLYDTGSSMFPIITGTNRLKRVAKDRKIDSIDHISAWGENIPLYSANELKENVQNLYLDNYDLGEIEIYGVENMNLYVLAGNYLYGITGNVIFNNKIVIIDRKNNKFGIIE
jgi:hypothetical protein